MLKRFTTHTLMALAEASLVALLVVGLIAGTAFAGKGGGGKPGGGGGGKPTGGSGTITWYVMDGADTTANYRERVAFNVTGSTDRPFVGLRCYQDGIFVLDGYTGYFPTYAYEPWITLGSPYWDPAVAADCTARLFYYNGRGDQIVLATTSFAVQP